MKKRVISALVAVAILFGVYFLKNDVVFNIAVVVVAILALGEFYHATRQINLKPIESVGYIVCLFLAFVGVVGTSKQLVPILVMLLPITFVILAGICVFSNLKRSFNDIAVTIMGIIYIPLMFLFLILTWQLDSSHLLIWFTLCGAWLTDVFAYLVGVSIGKHKFSKISPNKSIEGCIGGILGGALFFGIYSHVLNLHRAVELGIEFNVTLMTILGAFISVLAQIGDFFASAIKRNCKIKDFGSIMPGHGGMLDRFDSVLMISPIIYMLFEFIF